MDINKIRELSCAIIGMTYAFEKADKGEMNDLYIDMESIAEQLLDEAKK